MKKNKSLTFKIVGCSLLATAPFISLVSCSTMPSNKLNLKINKLYQQNVDIFTVEGGVLKGFKPGVTTEQIQEHVVDKTLNLPSCTSIADFAFEGPEFRKASTIVEKINISNATTTIGVKAFAGINITTIGFYKNTEASDPDASQLTTINRSAFANCKQLTSFTFPATVTKVDKAAFSNCQALTTLDFTAFTEPLDVMDIDWVGDVFSHLPTTGGMIALAISLDQAGAVKAAKVWSKLVTTGVPGDWGIQNLPQDYWYRPAPIDWFETQEIDNKLTLTGFKANRLEFISRYCNILWIPNTIKAISSNFNYLNGSSTHKNVGFNILYVEDGGVTEIPAGLCSHNSIDSGFAANKTLIAAVLPIGTIETIGESAFEGCTDLDTANINELTKLTTIGNKAFSGCTALCNFNFLTTGGTTGLLELPTTLKTIGEEVFYGCDGSTNPDWVGGITSIKFKAIPEGSSYGLAAFGNLPNLNLIDFSLISYAYDSVNDQVTGDFAKLITATENNEGIFDLATSPETEDVSHTIVIPNGTTIEGFYGAASKVEGAVKNSGFNWLLKQCSNDGLYHWDYCTIAPIVKGGSTNLIGYTNQDGADTNAWIFKNKGHQSEATFSLSNTYGGLVTIGNEEPVKGLVSWTSGLVEGTYAFNVKATYQDGIVESSTITLEIRTPSHIFKLPTTNVVRNERGE